MYAEVAWVLVSSGTQVQTQVILDPDYLPDYLSVSYDYGLSALCLKKKECKCTYCLIAEQQYVAKATLRLLN